MAMSSYHLGVNTSVVLLGALVLGTGQIQNKVLRVLWTSPFRDHDKYLPYD